MLLTQIGLCLSFHKYSHKRLAHYHTSIYSLRSNVKITVENICDVNVIDTKGLMHKSFWCLNIVPVSSNALTFRQFQGVDSI